MQRNYNFIYKELVENEYDIVGHIAYSLYKADKIKYIEDFKKKNEGKEPDDAELKPFHATSCLEGPIERYRLTASFILQQFLDNSLEESTKEIEDKCLKDHKQMLSNVIEPLKPKSSSRQFWFGVSQSIVGAFAFAFILAGLGFIALFKTNDINFSITTPQGNTTAVKINPTDTVPKSEAIMNIQKPAP